MTAFLTEQNAHSAPGAADFGYVPETGGNNNQWNGGELPNGPRAKDARLGKA